MAIFQLGQTHNNQKMKNLRALVDHGGGHPRPGVRVQRQAHVGGREINFAINRLLHIDIVNVGGE